MIQVLTNNILPVFSILALGFLCGRIHLISREEATTLNRIAFLILQPALIFPLINNADISLFYFDAIFIYGLCQTIVFLITFMICIFLLKLEIIESWLLAMCTIFINSVLYIWPISELIYGVDNNIPVIALVIWDASVVFAFFIISTEFIRNKDAKFKPLAFKLMKNPVLIAILLGIITNILNISIPVQFLTAMNFSGAAAAPLTLLALGVILSSHSLIPSKSVIIVSFIKLFLLILIVWVMLKIGSRPDNWNSMTVLYSAGPSGAMAFALAVLHNVKTDKIAPVIIWTSMLSLISLAYLA
jgi:malonate transporter and related proteins